MRLKNIRRILAILFWVAITGLFFDFTGTLHGWLGWTARIQFFPALLALNLGIAAGLLLLTLLFGRLYCSVICPLGIFQDVISGVNRKKHKYGYSPERKWIRYGILGLFVLALAAGISSLAALLEPYSAYGRMASMLFAPIYQMGNNLLAYGAEQMNSYAFYATEVWIKSIGTLLVATATFIFIAVMAWRGGRTYCNTICPVGTVLGFVSRFSFYRHRIDTQKCNGCGLCARNCKASCIDPQAHTVDYSRCVSCFNCLENCNKKAIFYGRKPVKKTEQAKNTVSPDQVDSARRSMLALVGTIAATSALKAQEKKVDGGLAFIEDKKIPVRQTPLVPAGSSGLRPFNRHCTGCQLCVSVCPNQVLRPSTALTTFMQPEVSYERGYCRPECTKCSQVCPAGAIRPISEDDKSSTQIGHAVWVEKNCVVLTQGVSCGNCARHCPTGAITMVERTPESLDGQMIPVINTERCIGCGACENLCPSRPFSAIYVEGHLQHRTI